MVELALPPGGFSDQGEGFEEFHRERGIPIRPGRGRHEATQFYVRFCFPNAAAAHAFRDRFGGVLADGYSPPRGPRTFGSPARVLTATAAARTSMLARPLATLSRDGAAHHAAWDHLFLQPRGYSPPVCPLQSPGATGVGPGQHACGADHDSKGQNANRDN